MARAMQKKHCWQNVRITIGEGYFSICEFKPIQTLVAMAAVCFGLVMGYLMFFVFSELNIPGIMFTATVLTLLPLVWVLVAYRMPHGLRIYPEQEAANRYRAVYGLRLFNKWTNLKDRALIVQPCSVVSMEAPDGNTKTAIALTGVLHATGIIGTILSLGVSNELKEKTTAAYAITAADSEKHLALLLSRSEADQVVEMYAAAKKNELDGYRRAPTRFEKRPGG